MSVFLRRLLAVLSVLAALVLALALAGLLPPKEPPAPRVEAFSIDRAIVPRSKLLMGQPEQDRAPATAARTLRFVPLCEAPSGGARWFKLALFAGQEALLVWCKQGYELFLVGERAGELELTRAARFKARGDLSGGAVVGDFDGDGQRDLVLGVAARPGVAHRSGAGVFWLRGRAEGGFDSARILAEISSVALAAYARSAGQADELFVLTSGDVAAQRPAELWLFQRAPSLSRKQALPVGLDPRGLIVRAGADAEQIELFVLTGQPGRLLRQTLSLKALAPVGEPQTVALRGAQAFAHEPSFGDAVFLRDATALYRLERAAQPSLSLFARDAHVGPFALTDLNADLRPDVFAANETGLSWLRDGVAEPRELTLPNELKVLDVESVRLGESRLSPVALVAGRPDEKTLSLLVLPVSPFQAGGPALSLIGAELAPGQSPAEVALE